MPLSLIALAIASFGIGTTEFVIMGLLPEVAADLGVSIPHAGLLITGYALGVVVGAPILAIATNRFPRKATLLGLVGLFILGNFLCAVAPTYAFLMAARVATAFGHGAFFGIAAVVAAGLVPANQRARAIALVFGGLTIANILGVPGGTALGQVFGWRATFWVVTAIGVAAALAIVAWVPAAIRYEPGSVLREFRVLKNPQVMLAMAMSGLLSCGLFAVFTYIAPLLREVTGIAPEGVTWVLILFGVGITAGNFAGGRLADWNVMRTLIGALAALVVVFIVFVYASQAIVPAAIVIFVWGFVDFVMTPSLQLRVVDKAHDAPNLASTLNQGAFNLGNAAGAWIGGAALSLGIGYQYLPFVGAAITLLALGAALLSRALDKRAAAEAYACA